jgi:Zn-dependent protease
MSIGILTALIVSLGWLISLCLHEFAHAAVAYAGGDKTVKDKGYLTLNPLKYADPGMTLALPLLILMIGGIALPGAAVYIDRRKLRNRLWHSLVSLAGPGANILCLLGLSAAFQVFPDADAQDWLWSSLALLAQLQTVAIILNLLPVPPLDGYGVIEPWLPAAVQNAARSFGRYGFIAIFAALWFIPSLNKALWQTADLIDASLGIPLAGIYGAFTLFRNESVFLIAAVILGLVIFKRAAKPRSHSV